MKAETMTRLAKPMLMFAALIWGTSFFIMKNTLDALPVFWLLACRFTVGAVLLGLFCLPKWKRFNLQYLLRGAVLGVLLFAAYGVQTFGLVYTTPSNNAFLTATYCVLVPFLYWLVAGQRPDGYNIAAALLCITGVGLVSLTGNLTLSPGDALTLLCALFYALHIVAVNKLAVGYDIYLLTAIQFAGVALCSFVGGLLFQPFPAGVFTDPEVVFPLLYLCVMATTVALLFQNVGQVWSDPSSASVILSLESVFGVLFSVLLYGDPITGRQLLGFGLIFLAVLCSETKLSFLPRRKRSIDSSVRL